MLKKKLKTNNNYLKINILYLILIIANIILFIGLISYYSKVGIDIDLKSFDYFSTVIPTIIILGIITSRFGRLKERDSTLYDVGYLIIITLLGLMSSYFSGKSNTAGLFGPYLEMFRMLCVILIFILMTLLLNSFKEILHGKYSKRNLLICIIVFTILGIYATHFNIDIDGSPANVRCMVVMISGLFGGPIVGIPVGLISGAFRYAAGGITAMPCAISTVLSGIIGSLIFIWNDKKFPQPTMAITLMFLFTGLEMLIVVLLTPPDISFSYVRNIYPKMLFASVIGIALFSRIANDEIEKMNTSNDDDTIEELENDLDVKDEIEKLKKEIEELKKGSE